METNATPPDSIPLHLFDKDQRVIVTRPGHVQGVEQTILEVIGYFREGQCFARDNKNRMVMADKKGWYYQTTKHRLHESYITAVKAPEPKQEDGHVEIDMNQGTHFDLVLEKDVPTC